MTIKKTKNTRKLMACLAIMMLFLVFPVKVFAISNPLDEIQVYDIKVDMRPDGTMDINYHLEWKVLDDSSEGPLTWVKIGIPNKSADEITALSQNIDKIEIHKEGKQVYAHVYFKRDYNANETVSFDFSIHQSNMYVIDKDEHLLRYSFTPGWFDEIQIKQMSIKWNSTNVLKSTSSVLTDDGQYYVWRGESLDFGEKLNASVYYNLDAFEATEDGQVQEESGISGWAIVGIIIIVILIIAFICFLVGDDDYGSGSGFGGSRTTFIHTGGGYRSSCACVSRCACACACAGGGRAGCSKKDFYHTGVKTDTLMKVLEEDV